MFLRLYFVISALVHTGYQASLAGRRACRTQGFNMTLSYLTKTYLQEAPIQTVSTMTLSVTIVFAYIVRIWESPFYTAASDGTDALTPFDSYLNACWFIIITITTVGYGDYTPVTPMGRFFSILVCFVGTFLISILIATFTNAIKLSQPQQLALV